MQLETSEGTSCVRLGKIIQRTCELAPGAYWRVLFFIKQRSANAPACLKTASNVPQKLPSGVPNGLPDTRNGTPKPHQSRPLIMPISRSAGWPPATGSGPQNTAKFDYSWRFPLPDTPLVQICKPGLRRKLKEAFITSLNDCGRWGNNCQSELSPPDPNTFQMRAPRYALANTAQVPATSKPPDKTPKPPSTPKYPKKK